MSKSPSNFLASLLMLALLVVIAFIGWNLLLAVRSASEVPKTISSGLATKVDKMIHPTPTIYPDPVTVILQVRSLARLETAQYTIEKVITAEIGQDALAPLFGDRLLFVAHGQVTAGVDLSRLADSDVTISPEGVATIILPRAEVFNTSLDNDKSYIYNRETGLLTHGDVNLETQARQVAQQEIYKAALEDGILKLAQTNAEVFMERFLHMFKLEAVKVLEATPMP